jgi:cytoskeletal protein CcmA (bactofilin family)
MWNRSKKDEDVMPARSAPVAPEPQREALSAPAYPARRSIEDAPTRAAAVIGKSLIVTGELTGKEDLLVDGRVEGDIELPENRLTVGVGGHVEGSIKAREIVVYGVIHGNMEAGERVEIKKNAKVIGDLRASRPVIEDEAYFKGNVETIRVDPPRQAIKPAVAAAAAAQAPAPTVAPAPAPAPAAPQTSAAINPSESRRG